jgi:predicted NBD/HSP70 family sugar kinase
MGAWMNAYEAIARRDVSIAVESADGRIVTRKTAIIDDGAHDEADDRYLERLIKFLLWSVGGYRVYICGANRISERLGRAYAPDGTRAFDAQFMDDVFERGFEIVSCNNEKIPAGRDDSVPIGGHLDGCRIGFDAGGSDRKVSAMIDGNVVYSEEVVWHPKTTANPHYHQEEIIKAFQTAAEKLPRVDAIGVSSAGVFVGNQPKVSSLFIKVPREQRSFVRDIFTNAARAVGDGNAPLAVANDGDVTALAGAMELNTGSVMGLAMGTSEAVGYINGQGNILGWFNELAFAPVDINPDALADEWSGDIGVGCKYFSQDAVIKLAPEAGIALSENLTPAEKLKEVQNLAEQGFDAAASIYRTIGTYLGHAIVLYRKFYDIRFLLLLGRVVSGEGGKLICSACEETLQSDYPELRDRIKVILPDEQSRRVGQSVAAASLAAIYR